MNRSRRRRRAATHPRPATGWATRLATVLAVALVGTVLGSCTSSDDDGTGADGAAAEGATAGWDVRPGVETVTVTGADAGAPLTLYRDDEPLLTLLADDRGQAHFAYLPAEHATVQSGAEGVASVEVSGGSTLSPGAYVVRDDSATPPVASEPFVVLDRDDLPDPQLYEGQELTGVSMGILGELPEGTSVEDGFQYIEMRDGVRLSAMVRFPDETFYGPGPYPTVVEYSGYGPSNPDAEEPGVRIARALGYATVAVNMRGTGCSGGVFDVFNPAQMADGYDVIEAVARQPWVLHGHVGMVGLSYSGITQLYTAATRPPSLAAVTPQSVMRDSWEQAWPGGIFNAGFTREWLAERDRQAAAGGTDWVQQRIDAGDDVCAGHMALRDQNPDFEPFVRALEHRPPSADDRSLPLLVGDIEVPVFLTGAFQDEQTGPQFTAMIDAFEQAPTLRVSLWNGRHPDGYGPQNLNRWFEFLELYVAQRVPVMNSVVRLALPDVLAENFQLADVQLEDDRFASFGTDLAAARAAYEAEDPIRVLFESGAGADELGEPGGRFEQTFTEWPPASAETRTWYLGGDGLLSDVAPANGGVDEFRVDPEAGAVDLFPDGGYPLLEPLWADAEWSQFADGDIVSYLSEPFSDDVVFAGPGRADLFVATDAADGAVMVTVSEVRPDGVEYLVQNGVVRLGIPLDPALTDGLEVALDFREEAYEPPVAGEVTPVAVELPAFNQVVRAGSQLRITVATPGRNFAAWAFDNPRVPDGATIRVVRDAEHPSAVQLTVLPGVEVTTGDLPACPSLRGQVCRPYEPRRNGSAAR